MKSEEELKELYNDQYVADYDNQPLSRLTRLLDLFKMTKTDDVIDFACGTGLLMPLVAPRVKSYTGIDFSESFIDRANEKKRSLAIENAEFVYQDIIDYCAQQPGRFDIGFALDFSEHVYDDSWLKILKAIRSSLKPGGKLYLHTPNGDFFLEQLKTKNILVHHSAGHIAVRTYQENVQIIEQAGFHINVIELLPHYNMLKIIHPLSFLPWVGSYFKARLFVEAVA